MSRINKVKKILQEKNINSFRIIEVENTSYQQFYDLEKLETVRKVNTLETNVTLYKEMEVDGKKVLGEASFIISHDESKANLEKLINDCLYQASFVHNEYYELVEASKKKSMAYKELEEKPFEILKNIACIFFNESKKDARFNALELFYDENIVHLVNSKGVDYKKKTFEISCEAIPSFYSDTYKTELYRMFKYKELNYDKIKEDAKESISDVYNRGKAIKLENVKNCNVLLHGKELLNLFEEVIYGFSYQSFYSHGNVYEIGDAISKKKLNIALDSNTKFDFFDNDGILLHKSEIVKNGVMTSSFGSNRYAYYLGKKATGNLSKVCLSHGKKETKVLKNKPYLELIDLSGIQVDLYQGYLGGEVRLALYYDGEKVTPVTGFSFTCDLKEAINNIELSKETENINYYNGPKLALIKNAIINC